MEFNLKDILIRSEIDNAKLAQVLALAGKYERFRSVVFDTLRHAEAADEPLNRDYPRGSGFLEGSRMGRSDLDWASLKRQP